MLIAIHAFENQYYGLHGIEHHLIVDVENIKVAEEWALEESRSVMDSYSEIIESFEDDAKFEGLEEGTEEYDEYIEECIQQNIGYQMWEIIDKYADIHTMEYDFFNNREEFVKEHCREIE